MEEGNLFGTIGFKLNQKNSIIKLDQKIHRLFYANYKDDIQLLKETGHNSFRTSIQWSRLIPDGIGRVNQKAVDFYNNVIDELIENGIEPFMNLYHFSYIFTVLLPVRG